LNIATSMWTAYILNPSTFILLHRFWFKTCFYTPAEYTIIVRLFSMQLYSMKTSHHLPSINRFRSGFQFTMW
jgi:hypothetical protein